MSNLKIDEALVSIAEISASYFEKQKVIGGRHMTEILAESMVREGYAEAANDLMTSHLGMIDVLTGKAGQGLSAINAGQPNFHESALAAVKGSKFEKGVQYLTTEVQQMVEVENKLGEKASDALAKAIDNAIKPDGSLHNASELAQRVAPETQQGKTSHAARVRTK